MSVGWVARRAYRWGGAALAGLGVVQVLTITPRNSVWLAFAGAAAIGAGVWFMPRHTVRAALGVAIAVATTAFAMGTPVLATVLGAMVAVFSLGRYVHWRDAWWACLALVAAVASVAIPQISQGRGLPGLVYPVALLTGAWLLGRLIRLRAHYVRTMADASRALERERSRQSAFVATSERMRIARQLHDAVSNQVGLIVVQAQAARGALPHRPEQAADALDGIGVAGRQAINDLRQLLGVLRDPTASLDVSDLIEPAVTAGLTVDLVQDGDAQAVRTPVRSAVYRIIQEALAGTLRRSTATQVRVAVHYGAESVDLEVVDNSAAPAATGQAATREHSLVLEPALEVDGEITVEPRSDGPGFRVRASLPTG